MHQISPIHLLIEIEIAVRFLLRLSHNVSEEVCTEDYFSLDMIHFPLHAKLFVAVRIQNKCVALNHLAYLNAPESFTPGSQMQELS